MVKRYIYSSIFLLMFSSVFAQKSTSEIKADKLFDRFAYKKAIGYYNESVKLSPEGLRRLAESYRNLGMFAESEDAYSKFILEGEFTDSDMYYYGMVLKSNGKYSESEKWLIEYAEKHPADIRSKEFLEKGHGVKEFLKDEGRYKVINLDMNSAHQEFAPAYYNSKLVYTSTLVQGVQPIKKSYSWNQKPFLDLYQAEISADGQILAAQSIDNKGIINKSMHEGAASFAKEGAIIAFTRNNYNGKSKEGVVKLQIFFSQNVEGKWQKDTPFKFNNAEYSVGHPSLTEDGKTMYFASDMPGGFGGTDIYKIEIINGSEWGEPINLGEKINTEGDEMYPFVHDKTGTLYFASEGHTGLGGLDIYMAVMNNKTVEKVLNMGAPINTNFDDFSLIIDKEQKKGYFASNRDSGKGDDDIYMFEILKPFESSKYLKGKVTDNKGNLLADAEVKLLKADGTILTFVKTDEKGEYSIVIYEANEIYSLIGSKDKFLGGQAASIKISESEDITNADIILRIPEFTLTCIIKDKATNAPLAGVRIIILNKVTGKEETFETGANGEFSDKLEEYQLNDRVHIELTIEKEGYRHKIISYDNKLIIDGEYVIDEFLEKLP